jgi:hypothetical protein
MMKGASIMKKLTALLVILSSWSVLAQSQEKSVPQHYRHPDAITMALGGSARMFPKTSAPVAGVAVDSIHYDEHIGQTFITVTNASNRDITAFALDLPPGTQMHLLIEEFLGGSGFFHPGETVDVELFEEDMKLESLPVPCAIVYGDVTAESTNSYALEHIKTYRESTAAAYERAVELAATTPDPEKLADELQAESDPPQQQGHSMPPLIKKKTPETSDKPEAKTPDRPTMDLPTLHNIAQQLVDGKSIKDIREQAERWRTHSKIALDAP